MRFFKYVLLLGSCFVAHILGSTNADSGSLSFAAQKSTTCYQPTGGNPAATRGQSNSRFSDFSRAGYQQGDSPLPNLRLGSNWFNVKDFGARGNTRGAGNDWTGTDDYPAIMKALTTLKDGSVLYFPPGRYTISRDIVIKKSITLKGAGQTSTVLHFPNSLQDIYGNAKDKFSQWSFGPGMITYQGGDRSGRARLAAITANAARGAQWLRVSDVSAIIPGMRVMVSASDPPKGSPNAGALIQDLYGGYKDNLKQGINDMVGANSAICFHAKVASVDRATKRVQLDRGLVLALDVNRYRNVELRKIDPRVQFAGVEDLAVRFKGTVYRGHHKETGTNGIYFKYCYNMWIRNVDIFNSDNSVVLSDTHFSTIENVVLKQDFPRGKPGWYTGHHGFWMSNRSSNNLVNNYAVWFKTFHDMSVEGFAHLNVFKNGKGQDMGMDHHCLAPYANLFTNIHLGAGLRGFKSGGAANRGAQTAQNAVYWNIQANNPIAVPEPEFGPRLTFVGVAFQTPINLRSYVYDWRVEMASGPMCVPDFHAASLAARRQG